MKGLLFLSLLISFVSCKGGGGSGGDAVSSSGGSPNITLGGIATPKVQEQAKVEETIDEVKAEIKSEPLYSLEESELEEASEQVSLSAEEQELLKEIL